MSSSSKSVYTASLLPLVSQDYYLLKFQFFTRISPLCSPMMKWDLVFFPCDKWENWNLRAHFLKFKNEKGRIVDNIEICSQGWRRVEYLKLCPFWKLCELHCLLSPLCLKKEKWHHLPFPWRGHTTCWAPRAVPCKGFQFHSQSYLAN